MFNVLRKKFLALCFLFTYILVTAKEIGSENWFGKAARQVAQSTALGWAHIKRPILVLKWRFSLVNIYNINLKQLRKNVAGFSKYGEVFFPVKTNHNPEILKELKGLCGFEIDSIDHLKKVLMPDNCTKIIYSNVVKSDSDLKFAMRHGIVFYTVDDIATLSKILALAKQFNVKNLRLNFRLNVYDIFRATFEAKNIVDSRLGASVTTIKEMIARAKSAGGISIKMGISFYVQAEVHSDKNFLIDAVKYILKNFKGYKFDHLNIGGGASLKVLEDSKKQLNEAKKVFKLSSIVIEPGRYLVGGVVDLKMPIIRITQKLNARTQIPETLVTLNAGIYHGLIDIILHNRVFDFYLLKGENSARLIPSPNGKIVLRGPTADSKDVLGLFDCDLNIDESDFVMIKNCGAYVESLESSFSQRVKTKSIITK